MSATEVRLPDAFWEGVDPGVQALLDAWLVEEGAGVEAGQAVARIVLVKTAIQVEAPASGRLRGILVPAGQTFARGQALARIED
jgi:biotin carboxyl carrier protein